MPGQRAQVLFGRRRRARVRGGVVEMRDVSAVAEPERLGAAPARQPLRKGRACSARCGAELLRKNSTSIRRISLPRPVPRAIVSNNSGLQSRTVWATLTEMPRDLPPPMRVMPWSWFPTSPRGSTEPVLSLADGLAEKRGWKAWWRVLGVRYEPTLRYTLEPADLNPCSRRSGAISPRSS